MFGTVKLTWRAVKTKFIYNGYRIAFYRAGTCSFGNEFGKHVFLVMTIVHQDILKIVNNFLRLDDAPIHHINDGVGETKKKL